jgi:uncharacterized repeat protein (TIGR01451 family)
MKRFAALCFAALLGWMFPAQALVITRSSSPIFYLDTSIAPTLQGMYVSYQVNNNDGVNYPDLWVRIDSFSGGVISLAPGEDGLAHLGPLAPGETKTAFFYLQATAATTLSQSHTARVFSSRPPAGSELASGSFSMTAVETIQANANKVITVVSGPNPAELGGIVTMTVSGDGGTVGSDRILSFSPAGYLNWRPDAYELFESTITLAGGNTGSYRDQLLIIAASSSATTYSAVYKFRAVTTTTAPTTVSPIGYISSGAQIKHTSTGDYSNLAPILPVVNELTLGKLTSVGELVNGGLATFSLLVTNAGVYDSILEDFTDTLPSTPATPTYVAGSSRFNGLPIGNPAISGPTLTWIGTFPLLAGTVNTLTFQVNFPTNTATYTNRAVGHVRSVQIDTTLDTSDNAPATAIVVVRSRQLSGFVYLDANRNLQKDGSEAGTGLSLFAKLIANNSPGPALQAVTVTNTTGMYVFYNMQPGTYRIVIDDNATLADVTPTLPSGWSGTEMPTQVRSNVVFSTFDVANQNFGLVNSLPLTGRVFLDNGAGGGTANDGVMNGGETGIANVTVRLQNSSGSTTYSTAVTTAAGNYTLLIPSTLPLGTVLKVVETNPSGHLSTGASLGNSGGTYDRATDMISFTLAAINYTGLDFGDVRQNSFLNDSQQTGIPGSFVLHPHSYIANSAGEVSFTLVNVPNPVLTGWNPVIYLDANCNAQLETTEQPLTGPIAVAAGDRVCILIKDFIPASAPINARDAITITAAFNYTNATPALNVTATRTALTVVGDPTTAGLTLTKSVDKATAFPGETITYSLIYANNSSQPLNNIVIFDNTPAFTTFLTATNLVLPPNLSSVATTTPSPGASGSIRWTFTGALASGQNGTVQFRVVVAP